MNINNDKITPVIDGPIPLILSHARKLGIADEINKRTTRNNEKSIVSTGMGIEAIITNILTDRKALYKVQEFYEGKDVEKYFGPGIKAEHFNDDTLGRILDAFYEANPKEIFTSIALKSIGTYNIKVKTIHADTTSKSVYGEYTTCEEDDLQIVRGHSKDHRPALKQIMFGLANTNKKVLVGGEVLNGNTSNKTWNNFFIQEIRKNLCQADIEDIIYTADSSFVTKDNLTVAKGDDKTPKTIFISRLPGNFNLEEELKLKALSIPEAWVQVGTLHDKKNAAIYKIQSFTDFLYDTPYRFIVCHSNHLDGRKLKALQTAIKRENDQIAKAVAELEAVDYYCVEDAQAALDKFIAENPLEYHSLSGKTTVEERVKKRSHRGRPRKDETKKVGTWHKVKVRILEEHVKIDKHKEKAGLFVLITNELDPGKISDIEVLTEYKEQSSVEINFKILKDPYFVDEIYLKNPNRVEAFGYILLLALMVYTLIEYQVREALSKEEEPLIIPGGIKSHKPTARAILELLENIMVLLITFENGYHVRVIGNGFNDNIQRLLNLAGFSEGIYTTEYIAWTSESL